MHPKRPRQGAGQGAQSDRFYSPFLRFLFLTLLRANRSLYHGGYLSTVRSSICANDFGDERTCRDARIDLVMPHNRTPLFPFPPPNIRFECSVDGCQFLFLCVA